MNNSYCVNIVNALVEKRGIIEKRSEDGGGQMGSKNILGLLKSMLEELPKAEKRIAEKILEEPEETIMMTASQLGKYADSSAATVIRLTKRLNLESFTEMKIFISSEIEDKHQEVYSDIRPDESVTEIMDKLHWNSSLAMRDTVSVLEEEALIQGADLIRNASVVYTFGVGASSLVAENIAQKWSRLGKTCIYITDPHILLSSMISGEKDTAFIGISNSGETLEVVNLAKMAKEYGHQTMAITQFGKNSLNKDIDVSLQHVRANELQTRSAATSSLHAQFLVVDILFYVYATRNYAKALGKIFDSREAVENYNKGIVKK